MKTLKINGGWPLVGEIPISGMKNAALPILFATIVTEDVCIIDNIPPVGDIEVALQILAAMGAHVVRHSPTVVEIDTREVRQGCSPDALVRRLRGSNYLIGAELSRYGRAKVGSAGGCNFGALPIDQHIKGFTSFGSQVEQTPDFVTAVVPSGTLRGAHIVLDTVSVGATANLLLASCTADGVTVIDNAAHEPHIVDLANFLNACGADITGAGTSTIRVQGVNKLHGCRYTIIPDMIEAGTYMVAAAATGGHITLRRVIPQHLEAVSDALRAMGVSVEQTADSVTVRSDQPLRGVHVQAVPYPGFPTDMQPQMTALLAVVEGVSHVTDHVFKGRFRYVEELCRMGAVIDVDEASATATVTGKCELHGAQVCATDLRAGAALVIAGLVAQGQTVIAESQLIERGYVDIVGKLTSLGADIQIIS